MVQIHSSGLDFTANVTSDGRLLVEASISGGIHIGSVSANVDSVYVQSGTFTGSTFAPNYSTRFEEIGSVTYVGDAVIGTNTGSANWKIKRITESGTTYIETLWADGNEAFDNVWDNRASLSYS